jgi:hypothetical protein
MIRLTLDSRPRCARRHDILLASGLAMTFGAPLRTAFLFIAFTGLVASTGVGCPTESSGEPDSSWTIPDTDAAPDTEISGCEDNDDCKGGSFCGPGDMCHVNRCLRDPPNCPADRRCDPLTGECKGYECTALTECLVGELCVDKWCVLEKNACGEDGCPKGQVCNYDAGALTAECSE